MEVNMKQIKVGKRGGELVAILKEQRGMEMVQVAILVAIAIGIGIIFKEKIGAFINGIFENLFSINF